MRIGLAYDLREDYLEAGFSELETAEFDRPDTIEAIENALIALRHKTVRIGNIRSLAARLSAGERWDLVFNICEGLYGFAREAQVPALLEAYDIPYVFSDAMVCALTLHKGMTKHVLRDNSLPTADFSVVGSPADLKALTLPGPWFVKPIAEGTSKGITAESVIDTRDQLEARCLALLKEYHQPVLVECFLPGREFTVGILGTGADARVLGILEVGLRSQAGAVYGYETKEHCEDLVDYSLLADRKLAKGFEHLALDAWRVLGCRDGGRVDLRLDVNDKPQILEINPLAGLHPTHSDLPILAGLVSMSYQKLIATIVKSALARGKLDRQRIAA